MNGLLISNEVRMTSVDLCDLINKFREEEGNDTKKLHKTLMRDIRNELKTLESLGINTNEYFKPSQYKDIKGEIRPSFLITIKGLEWLRDNSIHDVKAYNYAIKQLNPNYQMKHINIASTYTRKELLIHKILLAWFEECQIKSQYPVLNYRLDYYIPDCYLVIEYDEATGHKDIEKDNNRKEDVIEFIRIKEFEEEKGLNELFEFLTGDVKWASKLENLNR